MCFFINEDSSIDRTIVDEDNIEIDLNLIKKMELGRKRLDLLEKSWDEIKSGHNILKTHNQKQNTKLQIFIFLHLDINK